MQHKKPSLIQRLTKSGVGRQEARLTVGEQLAKAMMRKRARERYTHAHSLTSLVHYVETRDDLELKVARINKRLQKMVVEGEHVCPGFRLALTPAVETPIRDV